MSFLSHHNQQNSGGYNQQINIDNSVHNFNMNGAGRSTTDVDKYIGWFIAFILVIAMFTTFLYKVINPYIINYNWLILVIILIFAAVNIGYALKMFDMPSKKIAITIQSLIPSVVQVTLVHLNPHKQVTQFLKLIKLNNMSEIQKSIIQFFNAITNVNGVVVVYIFIQCVLFLLLYFIVIINTYDVLHKNRSIEVKFQVIVYLVIVGLEVFSQYIIK